jgi:predicted dehydrogenase
MTSHPIRAGFVGAGFFGALLADMCARHDGFEVTRVLDHDAEAAARLASRTGAVVSESLESLAADDEVDLVFVATPNHTHAQVAGALLVAGKDVFVEKPLTIDAPSARELVRLAEQHDRVLLVGHVLRAMPGVRRMYAAVRAGEIGVPTEAYASRLRLHHAPDHPADWWKLDLRRSGGELLHEVHELDLLVWFLGEPDRVSQTTGEHLFKTTMAFPNGAVASHELSTASHFAEWQLRVSGTVGTLRADFRAASVEHWVDGVVIDSWPIFDDEAANQSLLEAASLKQGHHTGSSASPLWMQEAVLRELGEVHAAVRRGPNVLVSRPDLAVAVATGSLTEEPA